MRRRRAGVGPPAPVATIRHRPRHMAPSTQTDQKTWCPFSSGHTKLNFRSFHYICQPVLVVFLHLKLPTSKNVDFCCSCTCSSHFEVRSLCLEFLQYFLTVFFLGAANCKRSSPPVTCAAFMHAIVGFAPRWQTPSWVCHRGANPRFAPRQIVGQTPRLVVDPSRGSGISNSYVLRP